MIHESRDSLGESRAGAGPGGGRDAGAPVPRAQRPALLDYATHHAPSVMYAFDAPDAARRSYIGATAERLTGHRPARFLAAPDYGRELIHPQDRPGYAAALEALGEAGEAVVEYRLRRADGTHVWVRDHMQVVSGADADAGSGGATLVGCLTDISAQREAQRALDEAQAFSSALVDRALNCIVAMDTEGTIVAFNPTAERTFGYSRDAVIGRNLAETIIPERFRDRHNAALRSYLETGEATILDRQMEIDALRADGTEFPARLHVTEAMLDGRRVFVGDLSDLSRQKRESSERRRALQLLRDAIESIPNGFAVYDAQERLVLCNTAYAAPYGESPERMIGHTIADVAMRAAEFIEETGGERPQDVPDWPARLMQTMRAASGVPEESRLKDGRWVKFSSHRTTDGGIVFVRTDITAQIQAQTALRESEQHFRRMVEDHPAAVWMVTVDTGEILYQSPAAAKLFQRENTDKVSTHIYDYYANPNDRAVLVRRLRERGVLNDYEIRLKRTDGGGVWVSATCRLISHEGREYIIANMVDLTERKQRESEAQRAQEVLEDAIESLTEGFALYDQDDRLVICNSRFRALNSGSADQLVPGAKWIDLLRAGAERGEYVNAVGRVEDWLRDRIAARQKPSSKQEVELSDGRWFQISHQRTRQGGTVGIRTEITHLKQMEQALRESEERFRGITEAHPLPVVISRLEDGCVLYASPAAAQLWGKPQDEIVGSPIQDYFSNAEEFERTLAAFKRQGYLDSFEVQQRHADGSLLPVALTTRPITYGGDRAVVTGLYDLAELTAAEQQITAQREALYQSEKLNALGAVLAGVAHELNNPLSVVVGQALLLQETAKDPALAKRAARIGNAADRCARIVRTFLSIARQRPPQRADVDLNEIVDSALEIAGYSMRTAQIQVVRRLDPDLPRVWADPDQISQVLMNLFVNAQQAMTDAGSLRPKLKVKTRFDADRGEVTLQVKDTGPGIDDAARERIFDPFFTTKTSGTGVGLAITRAIIQAHQGTINVDSEPEVGAVFTITLPARIKPARAERRAPPCEPASRACHVLVIDDDTDVLHTVRDVLATDGHEVVTATTVKDALQRLAEQPFEAILSDLRMPGLDGPALYRLLSGNYPELVARTAFITGDTLGPSARDFLAECGRPCLEKPFTPDEVRALVRNLADHEGADHDGAGREDSEDA